MAACEAGTSAAQWKWETHQRSWWRNEQLSVNMALSAALHHSRVVGTEDGQGRGRERRSTETEKSIAAWEPEPFQLFESKVRRHGGCYEDQPRRGTVADGEEPSTSLLCRSR